MMAFNKKQNRRLIDTPASILGRLGKKSFVKRKDARLHAAESLEARLALTAQAIGDTFVVEESLTVQTSSAVAATEANRIWVYEGDGSFDSQGIFVEVQDAQGVIVAATQQVNSTSSGVQSDAVVAADAVGNFVIAWSGQGEGDRQGIFFQRYASDGSRLGGETLVNSIVGGNQVEPAIAVAEDGTFAIAWSGVGEGDFSGIFLQRYDADGIAQGDVVSVNTTTDDHQTSASIAFDSAGNLVVVWQSRHQDGDSWGVYGQWYTSAGLTIGSELQLNSTTANSQSSPTVVTDPTGGSVVAWQSRDQDGDSWGVVARHFDITGSPDGAEVLLNDSTVGHQLDVSLAVAEDGQWLTAWTSGAPSGSGWEVVSRNFDDLGVASDSFIVNQNAMGANSGNQETPAIAVTAENAVIIWSGQSSEQRKALFSQNYMLTLIDDGDPTAPKLALIADDALEVGEVVELTVTATDINFRDDLTFTLDTSVSPATATIEQIDNYTAIIRWAPTDLEDGMDIDFRVIVTDDSDEAFSDDQTFVVSVGTLPLSLDLNGPNETGTDATVDYVTGSGAAVIADPLLQIRGADAGIIKLATIELLSATDADLEILSVDTTGTAITASYDSVNHVLTLTGEDNTTNYHNVLRSLSYDNTSTDPSGERTVRLLIVDSVDDSVTADTTMTILSPDLVAFAQALSDSGARLFGAEWDPTTTSQRELFQDGSQFLPYVEVTTADRMTNEIGLNNNIGQATWIFGNGVRVEGEMTLAEISEVSGIAIPASQDPTFVEVPDQTLLVGSPSVISLDGYDANGGKLTYTVVSDNTDVAAEIFTDNRSARVSVAGYGDMVFELFEDLAPLATEQMITLAEDGFYEDIIFHRILDNFVIQGGDPTGTGTGGSTLEDFDDQFSVDLQHNRTGLLSMAKSTDDTNDSQFFITEGDNTTSLRNLDFNHTIFGVLVEGEAVRESISNTAVDSFGTGNPDFDPTMEGIEIFEDDENAVLFLKAVDGATGTANITVTVTDEDGNSYDQTFEVTLEADTFDGNPFLGEIAPQTGVVNTPVSFQLTSEDVEGDDVFYFAENLSDVAYTFTVSDEGLVEVTPPTDFVGELEIEVSVGNTDVDGDDSQLVTITFTDT